MVADMFQPHEHSFAVAHVVFSSVGGALLGPIVGGFIAYYVSFHIPASIVLRRRQRLTWCYRFTGDGPSGSN